MTKIDDIDLKANYTFNNGITVNADSLQRAEEKQKRSKVERMKIEIEIPKAFEDSKSAYDVDKVVKEQKAEWKCIL